MRLAFIWLSGLLMGRAIDSVYSGDETWLVYASMGVIAVVAATFYGSRTDSA